ncbi:uncharacterized protein A1O5_06372 [Cladophialophora psammophila CBS 110553]|uniref:Uncharacterized protein n=1 Tax=Cladophialophora psammophila CBS 110553 TaxID=1182543 RepID=W9XIW5_9EURO|nr:uncharacterized protein A1O5_06372 [Cladophialophora psammophila CBS 110553]EXJ70304.1 hypothetical protein A1O5_06372 [Cladophialophora psammophila CBS 110553]
MNMTGMNPAAMAPGGPVGGGMIMMNNGSPATQVNMSSSPEQLKAQLNTYIYEYFLKLGHYDLARSLLREEKFEVRTKPPVKQSPGRRKDVEVNGVDGDAMDTDVKDDIPEDLPRPMHVTDANTPGIGFLFEWFSIFSDLFTAHRSSKMQGGQGGNMGPAAQYLIQHQNMQRMRENQQNQNLTRPGMMTANRFAIQANLRNNVVNGNNMANKFTPQQIQQQFKQQMLQQQQQQQMQREQGDVDMNGRASSPAEGENGGSPSKRPRLEGQQFNGGIMPNVRPGMPNVAPQNMMIQNTFNPNMNNAQFRQNGGMPQKPMQAGMANGMINMGNAGSPMMQGMNPQFDSNMQMEMYNQRMAGQQMPGGPGAGPAGNHALQDYQMQLMLLEQQNKKRLMMARQEQDNAVNRDGGPGGPMIGMPPGGMSPSGSRTGTSPNPVDQMKRTPQLGGLPGSPSAGDMAGRSPGAMNFMNGIQGSDFNPNMFMKDNQGMVPGAPGMRPPTSMDMQANMARQQQNRMGGQFQGGQPMVQQPSQGGGPQPMGTPGQRNEMPPPQAPAGNNAQRNQPGSPQSGNAPPTPSTTNKQNPKKKAKEEGTKKRPTKKSSTAAAPTSSENEPPATPTPSTPITPVHPPGFNNSAGKGAAAGMPNPNQAPPPNAGMPPNQPQMHQPDLTQPNAFTDFNTDQNFNLDFSSLENSDVLENFDFDSFLNTSNEDTFNFDNAMGIGGDFGVDTTNE